MTTQIDSPLTDRETAKRIADAVCNEFCWLQIGDDVKTSAHAITHTALHQAVVRHLAGPERLEWKYAATGKWTSDGYRIVVMGDGFFNIYCGDRFMKDVATLKLAKQAAQDHADGRQG